ncbi:inner membrane protein [Klebsiella pneumoniae subsp. rhinoscleromatis]|nr:inner membrane protein [Klebsiella pneumoniae subsp. rhinoscleromatis]
MFSAHSRLRHAVADTFAMVVYCTVVNMMIEIFLSGMTFEQSLSSRLVAIPVNIIIAVPYGIYRDFAMRQARRISPARWMKNMADVLAYVTFQSPVYVAILWSVGADWHQIVARGELEPGGINDDGRRLRLLPRLLPPPVPRGALSAGEGLTNALAATGSASRLFPPARLAWILKCLSPY